MVLILLLYCAIAIVGASLSFSLHRIVVWAFAVLVDGSKLDLVLVSTRSSRFLTWFWFPIHMRPTESGVVDSALRFWLIICSFSTVCSPCRFMTVRVLWVLLLGCHLDALVYLFLDLTAFLIYAAGPVWHVLSWCYLGTDLCRFDRPGHYRRHYLSIALLCYYILILATLPLCVFCFCFSVLMVSSFSCLISDHFDVLFCWNWPFGFWFPPS